jgi:hypothetical protein
MSRQLGNLQAKILLLEEGSLADRDAKKAK